MLYNLFKFMIYSNSLYEFYDSFFLNRLTVLESLLNKQRQASASYQTREIQGALNSCQGLIAEVNKQSECSIPECIEENDTETELCECHSNADTKMRADNRSLLMTYAQTGNNTGAWNGKEASPKNACAQHKKRNGITVPASVSSVFGKSNSKNDRERTSLVQYPMSSLKQKSKSES